MKFATLLALVLAAVGCSTSKYRKLPSKVPLPPDTSAINGVALAKGPWVPPAIMLAQAKARASSEGTNKILIRPEGSGFRFNTPHATNDPGYIWFSTHVDGFKTGDKFVALNATDSPTNSTAYGPNAANPHGRPTIFARWEKRVESQAFSATSVSSFEAGRAAAIKQLGRKAKDYGMRPDGSLVKFQ